MVTLRTYTPAEEPAILRCIQAYFGNGPDMARETLEEWLMPPNKLYFVVRGGQAAGCLRLGFRGGNVAWIEDIFVDENLRGQGIASAAIAAAEDIARARPGYTAMHMEVVPRNESAMRLYHKLGYDSLSLITLRKNFDDSKKEKTVNLLGLELRY